MRKNTKSNILGVTLTNNNLAEITEYAAAAIDSPGSKVCFACANPHSLVAAQHDAHLLDALRAADIVVADGVGITMMARILNIPVGPRIAGEDFFRSLMDSLVLRGAGRVFFFGSTSEVLKKIEKRFTHEYSGLTLCGTLSPPFRSWSGEENDAMIRFINTARPDVLWVGMTAPKQEKWIHKNIDRLNAKVIGAVGAVFDFYAGTYPRAPKWMCNIGCEWLYRLLQNPKRMWRRNFVSNPKFVVLMLRRYIER